MSDASYFDLPYWVSNNGDGSVSVKFLQTLEDAELEDEAQEEGWAESSAYTVRLKVENNQLFLRKNNYIRGKWVESWLPIQVQNG